MSDISGRRLSVKEECINYRLALYLEQELRQIECLGAECAELRNISQKLSNGEIKIDVEYDLGSFGNNVGGDNVERKQIANPTPNHPNIFIRPDILIHGRVNHENNIAFIEVKKRYRSENDNIKCKSVKAHPYNYKHVFIIDCILEEQSKMRVIEFHLDGDPTIHKL